MDYSRWEEEETLELFSLARMQYEIKDIASILNRTEIAVRKKLTREGFINKSIWVRKEDETSAL